jgi:hypothetical protein
LFSLRSLVFSPKSSLTSEDISLSGSSMRTWEGVS